MKEPYQGLKKKLDFFSSANKNYKHLRKHLDKQPVGFQATPTGVEIRLLKEIFTSDEAGAALNLSYKFEPFDTIYARAKEKGVPEMELKSLLESMDRKGCIFVKHDNDETAYALHPFAIGMFEMQISRLTPSFFLDSHNYMLQRFAVEYLSTEVPQMRVIPIEKSVTPDQNIATYDQIRDIVDRTEDRITIGNCICKAGRDLIGDPCEVTDRRDVCIGFRDFSDTFVRHGWARAATKEEAMEVLGQNEKDKEFIPPKDHDALYETIMQNKKGLGGQMAKMTKAIMGMRT